MVRLGSGARDAWRLERTLGSELRVLRQRILTSTVGSSNANEMNLQNNLETKSLGLPQQWKKKKRRTFSLQEFGRAIARKASSVRKSTRRLIADIRHKTPKSEQLNRRNSHNQYVLASVALTAAHNKTLLDMFD